ncbi:MAG: segregation/condensation protein A [Sandaracinaceae bacterium]|nr:segregation/condensation protein A [Sandaracinaceae bacterium]
MSDAPDPLDPSFTIALPAFEGPLDLLLHLIRKHELDILDLPIAFVTERYLAYVSLMERLDLDLASEYLVMAATLAHIKSKMLLPQEAQEPDEDEAAGEEIDPRAELIRRLLEYQKYKAVAEDLGARGSRAGTCSGAGARRPRRAGPRRWPRPACSSCSTPSTRCSSAPRATWRSRSRPKGSASRIGCGR